MLDPKILELIQFYNPWWRGQAFEVPIFRRDLYGIVKKFLPKRQIIAIVGLRRVGKTVLMKQLIQEIPDKQNCFYFVFDNTMAKNPDLLHDIISNFLQNQAKSGQKWIFLDEIHYMSYWKDVIKRFYDTHEDIKFLVTGSASLSISQSKESLAGRIYDLYLPPLSFREYLEMHGIHIDILSEEFQDIQKAYENNLFQQARIESLFLSYVQRGGFPELVFETDPDVIRAYLRSSVIDHILQTDIPAAYGVRRRDVLQNLFEFCAKESSNLIEFTTLSSALKVSLQTIKEYMMYLEEAFLIDLLFNYSGSIVHRLQKNKKVHLVHPAIALAILRYPFEIVMVPEVMGQWVETLCFQHAKQADSRIAFWRNPQKEEVDLILEGPPLLPIEIKYRNQISPSDMKAIKKFMADHQLQQGIIVSKDRFEQIEFANSRIWMMPAWLFLLIRFP